MSGLLIQELSTRATTVHAFDTAALASFKLGNGPDLQYWYTKLCYLLDGQAASAELSEEDYESLADEDQANLLRVLAQYPEVVNATYHSLEPAGVVTYLAAITDQLSDCLGDDDDAPVSTGLAAVYEAARVVLQNGMRLLGLVPIPDIPRERADTPVG
jgi:arginyl-tRNA synthetase